MKQDFSDLMQEARDLAVTRRNRGLHTGKAAKGWNVSRPDESDQLLETIAYYRTMLAKHCRVIPSGKFDAETEIPF